jgi:EAL domain-containing protein (putative c-di-GMP-specific phosphodiesterase class I)/GGDEF domain-containing protein
MYNSQGRSIFTDNFMIKTIIIVLALFISIASYAKPLLLSQLDLKTFKAHDHLFYKTMTENPLSIEQAIKLSADQFSPVSHTDYSPKLGSSTFYRLSFSNDTEQLKRFVLQIDNPMIDQLELFLVVEKKVIEQTLLGDYSQSIFTLKDSLPHFNLKFVPHKTSDVYLRVTSKGSTIIPIILHDDASFQTQIYKTFLTWGAFIGIILIMTAYNTLLYLGIRDNIYLFYIGYIIVMLVQLGIIYGYGFHLFPFELQRFFSHNVVVFNYVISIVAILFALFFLRYDIQKTRVYRVSLMFCGLLVVLGIVTFFIPKYLGAKIYYPIQLMIFLLIGRICIPKIFDGNNWSTYYLISWLPLFAGTTIAQVLLLDIVDYNYFTRNALLFSVVVEIAFISLALAERFRANENEKLYNVTHDSVTGLPNMILLTECAGRQMARQQPFTLILFQAERFREIKPALGLIAANNMVTAIVDNVSDYFSAMDNLLVFENNADSDIRISRINDDTFGLLLLGDHAQDELSYIILTIQEAVSTPINVGGYSVSTSCSVGSVSYPQYGINADLVIQKALHSLDMAKKEDAKFAFYSDNHKADIQEQLQLVADLQKAIDNDTLEIYHQPQIDLAGQTVCGNEALLRWNHETRGFISPEIFVTLAEDTGIINQLTEWVITRSLEQHAQMIEAGFCQNISINLSAKDLTQPGLIAHIMTSIADLSLDPTSIIFELTESATSDDPVHALKTINQLHELNLKVAIDDFGTGYSSLEYLSKLPFHELKVDKSFVLDILQSDRDQAITKTTIEMAKNLNIFVVAEGIETVEIEDLLRSYNCEIGQGYLYSKPLPLDAYLAWMRSDSIYVQKQYDNQAPIEMPLTAAQ